MLGTAQRWQLIVIPKCRIVIRIFISLFEQNAGEVRWLFRGVSQGEQVAKVDLDEHN